ncbi:type VI secretion protein, partial [Stenotrophomonas sp. 278]
QTKDLFKRWLFYGIGTMFSMAVLAAMVGIALDMVIRVASTFWLTAAADKWILQDSGAAGFTSQAMQQGGMGLILTTLILTAPPMAAMFFQGTLGGFMAYSQIGGSAAAGPQGQPPGAVPERTKNADDANHGSGAQMNEGRTVMGTQGNQIALNNTTGKYGNAPIA